MTLGVTKLVTLEIYEVPYDGGTQQWSVFSPCFYFEVADDGRVIKKVSLPF